MMMYDSPIPAVPYFAILKQYAKAQGMKFWTWKEIQSVMSHYEFHAKTLN